MYMFTFKITLFSLGESSSPEIVPKSKQNPMNSSIEQKIEPKVEKKEEEVQTMGKASILHLNHKKAV